MKSLYTFFALAIKQNLFGLNFCTELLDSEKLLPQNTPQRAFLGFLDNKDNFEIINHLRLYLSIIFF